MKIFFAGLFGACALIFIPKLGYGANSRPCEISIDSLINIYNKSGNDSVKSMRALDVAGDFENKNSAGDDAKKWLKIACDHARKSKSKICLGYCYIYTSYIYYSKDPGNKYEYLDSAASAFPKKFYSGRSFLQHMKVRYDQAYNRNDRSLTDFAVLKEILRAMHADNMTWSTFYYSPLAFYYWSIENYPEAKNDFVISYRLLEEDKSLSAKQVIVKTAPGYFANTFSIMASTANNAGLTYYKLDSLSKAVLYYKKGLLKFQAAEDHPGLAWSYQLIGECYTGLGMPNEATPWILKSIDEIKLMAATYSEYNQAGAYVSSMEYLEDALFMTKDYELLIKNIDECFSYVLKVSKSTGEFNERLADLLLQKAKAYACQYDLKDVGAILKSAHIYVFLDQYPNKEQKEIKSAIQENYAHYYMLKAWLCSKDSDRSGFEQYRSKSLVALDNINDWVYRIGAYNKIKWYLVDSKDWHDVIARNGAYFTHLTGKKDILKQRSFADELSSAYANTGNYDSAYKYKSIYAALNDSIINTQRFYALADLAERYKGVLDKSELERKNVEMSKQHAQNVLIFSICILVLVMVSIILFLNRQRLINLHRYEIAEREKMKLTAETQQKELSDTALELVKSNNAYEGLLHKVEHIGKNVKGDNRRHLRQLIINQKFVSQAESWKHFNAQFEKMNSRFYHDLLAQQPGLTESERKICALMALGLSNKEISAVSFQPIRSIYTYKNRLRKRFAIDSDEELSKRLSELLTN